MIHLLKTLWRNESGFIVSAELVTIATLLVIGLVTGLSCVQKAMVQELNDVAEAMTNVDQGYSYAGMHGCRTRCGFSSWTAGSANGANLMPEVAVDFCPNMIVSPPTEVVAPLNPQPIPPAPTAAPAMPGPCYQIVPCPPNSTSAPMQISPPPTIESQPVNPPPPPVESTPCPCGKS